jgi:hypothetical protein
MTAVFRKLTNSLARALRAAARAVAEEWQLGAPS